MQRTPFEWLTQVAIPVLALLGTITSVLKDQPRIAGLLALAVLLSLAASLIPLISRRVRSWLTSRRCDRTARTVWPELARLVEIFGKFIDHGRSDTVHGVVSQFFTPQSLTLGHLVRQYDFVVRRSKPAWSRE